MLKVSVVFATHKRFDLFVKCVESLLNQDYQKPYEVIAVHDGCDHGYDAQKIKKLEEGGVFKFFAQSKGGAAAARNYAIKQSSGEYILAIDDDCVTDKSWIAEMVSFLDNHKECPAVGGQVLPANANTFIEKYIALRGLLRRPPKDKYGKIITIVTANAAYRRECLQKIGFFSSVFKQRGIGYGGEDMDVAFKLKQFGDLGYNQHAQVSHFHRSTFRQLAKQYFMYGRGTYVACINNDIDFRRLLFLRPTLTNVFIYFVRSIIKVGKRSLKDFGDKKIPLRYYVPYLLLDYMRKNVCMFGIYCESKSK